MAKKTYIVAPNLSISPDSLHLGDIIVDPLGPELTPLNASPNPTLPLLSLKTPIKHLLTLATAQMQATHQRRRYTTRQQGSRVLIHAANAP